MDYTNWICTRPQVSLPQGDDDQSHQQSAAMVQRAIAPIAVYGLEAFRLALRVHDAYGTQDSWQLAALDGPRTWPQGHALMHAYR
jgi:hypothetical protein